MKKITRRQAITVCAAPLLARDRPRVAITMDDVLWQNIPEDRRPEAEDRLFNHVARTKVFLFTVGQWVDNDHGRGILKRWSDAGHLIGNHTYSHRALKGDAKPEEFEQDILRNEPLLAGYRGFRKFLRFPELKEGDTREARDHVRAFLAKHGYRNGAVTIDASDWYYEQRLSARIKADPKFDVARYREPYLNHTWERAQFYDQLSRDVLGRSVAHTLLVHYTFLNSLFLGDVLAMFRSKGWGIIHADEAFSDPVFRRQPDIVPAGESLISALAKESGKFDALLSRPSEDGVFGEKILDRLGL